MTQNDNKTDGIEQKRTYQCLHCGGEAFGLIVDEGIAVGARCRLCETIVTFENRTVDAGTEQ